MTLLYVIVVGDVLALLMFGMIDFMIRICCFASCLLASSLSLSDSFFRLKMVVFSWFLHFECAAMFVGVGFFRFRSHSRCCRLMCFWYSGEHQGFRCRRDGFFSCASMTRCIAVCMLWKCCVVVAMSVCVFVIAVCISVRMDVWFFS